MPSAGRFAARRTIADAVARLEDSFIFGSAFEDEIGMYMLRRLIDLGPVMDEQSRETMRRLGSTASSVAVDVCVYFPRNEVAPAASGLRAVDRAWRVAMLVAKHGEEDLPLWRVRLDELMPPEVGGFLVESVEAGSVKVSFEKVRAGMKEVQTFATALLVMRGLVGGMAAGDAPGHPGITTDGRQCQVQVAVRTDESLASSIRRDVGTLPPDCVVTLDVTTRDGASITVRLPGET